MAPRSFRIRLTDIRGEIAGIRELTKDADADRFAANWAMISSIARVISRYLHPFGAAGSHPDMKFASM